MLDPVRIGARQVSIAKKHYARISKSLEPVEKRLTFARRRLKLDYRPKLPDRSFRSGKNIKFVTLNVAFDEFEIGNVNAIKRGQIDFYAIALRTLRFERRAAVSNAFPCEFGSSGLFR